MTLLIVGGNEDEMFQLNPVSHALIAAKTLDRELQDVFEIIVQATEDCRAVPQPISQFDPLDNTLLSVLVYVDDENDNSPVFERQVFTGGVSTDLSFGTSFMSIHAEDLDHGVNAEVEYSVCGPVERSHSEGFGSEKRNLFLVEPQTGDIRLNFDPQENQKGYFSFSVCARDVGGLGDTARVVVYLLRQDQRVKFVTRSQPQEIRHVGN